MRVWIDIKEWMNENELYGEKNRSLTYVPRFVIDLVFFLTTTFLFRESLEFIN